MKYSATRTGGHSFICAQSDNKERSCFARIIHIPKQTTLFCPLCPPPFFSLPNKHEQEVLVNRSKGTAAAAAAVAVVAAVE